eukprot:3553368-Amphidinium_carterae.1
MQLPRVPGWEKIQQIHTQTGVKQGGVNSPLAYVLYQSAAEAEFAHHMAVEHVTQSLPSVSLWGEPSTHQDLSFSTRAWSMYVADPDAHEGVDDGMQPFDQLSYFDDMALPRWDVEPETVIRMIAKIADIGLKVFARYNLQFNLSAGKTEAAFYLHHRATAILAGFATTAVELEKPGILLRINEHDTIQVVRHYKYLGCWAGPSLDWQPEVLARKTSTRDGVKGLARVLRHSAVALPIKVRMVGTFAHSRLFVGLTSRGHLNETQHKTLAHTYYWSLLKCFQTVGVKPRYSHAQLVQRTKTAPFSIVLHCRRLRFFQRVIKSGSTI